MKEKKESIPVEILCEDFPAEFPKYFKYIQSLEFEEEPDYTWIKRLFKDLFERSGYQNNRVFDWAQKHQYWLSFILICFIINYSIPPMKTLLVKDVDVNCVDGRSSFDLGNVGAGSAAVEVFVLVRGICS